MATVTITEILGGDNIAASRIVLNNNFTLLQNAINTLETRLNTSYVPGGSLNVGDVQVLKYSRAITANIFLCQASAQIDGNLSLGTPTNNATLGITGSVTASGTMGADGNVDFNNVGGSDVFTNYLSTIADDSFANEQWYAPTVKSAAINTQGLSAPYVLPITTNMSVVYLDVTGYTGSAPNNINTFQLPAVSSVNNGQIVTLTFTGAAAGAGTFELDNSVNFDLAFDNTTLGANIEFNSTIVATDDKLGGIWITLAAGQNGWKVIGAHGDATYF